MLSKFTSCKILTLLFLTFTIGSCQAAEKNDEDPKTAQPVTITINPSQTFQSIDHFGASDAWACQFVGNWPDAKRNAIADLLFSQQLSSDGQPKGIGLSLWRFNIGAGSAEQGDQSGINDEWRRAESFLNENGAYNWDKQAGQIWFLNAAKARGVNEFLAFPNSPPVQFTINKKGYASNGKTNLATGSFPQFASFLADVISGVSLKTGITFNHISPVNEPQWDWSDGGQEGTPFYNNEIAQITRFLSAALIKKKLDTKIDIAEAGQIDYLYSEFNKQDRQNQIYSFFNKASANYVGDLPNLSKSISGHSYFTTSPYKTAAEKRTRLSEELKTVGGLKYWMSEYCILGDNEGEIKGEGKDPGIEPGLYVARVIHNDLVNANASAWHWWLAISPYNYKDGLISIDKNKTDGNFQATKMLWALGQYSRFIRPGAVRTGISINSDQSDLLVSSYLNTSGELVIVIINSGTQAKEIVLKSNQGSLLVQSAYQTSAESNLGLVDVTAFSKGFSVNPKSILTIIAKTGK
ncbi:glycoside hydrolase family 30 protein [Dyadobacter subterraneus]|uniref:Glycoside hydrolase family 30 protein n=1 Tax=Dyadobacter subterraneus TaxID=2773304 RepID=A0ABR9WCF0_9BACT|nr:glycoside hydrolase family 30 protein [Dyadobacter subterraneus]MBE9462676.1 glycoside hydrolase family 30 protein [Dyadobacter subterraneus]